ncbi:MAG: ABC transporter permease subunit [Clostridia bacterium]
MMNHLGRPLNRFSKGSYLHNHYQLYLFLLPALVYILIFQYWPIYGVQIAFKDFKPGLGIEGSPWVGLKHFDMFFNSYFFGEILGNTLKLSLLTLLFGFPIPILLALLLNQLPNQRYKRLVQTITYAPYFISTVVLCGMLYVFLSVRTGIFNHVIVLLGGRAINFIGDPRYFRTIYVASGVWQMSGFNAIIYLAALAGISPELHEAAVVDGATKLQRVIHIDIPSIMPTIVMLLILNTGSLMSIGFEKAFLLQSNFNVAVSEIISTYVYKAGIEQMRYSFASAVDLVNSVVNMTLLLTVNAISRKVSGSSLW